MIEKREKFGELLEEYKKLNVTTRSEAQVLKRGQPYRVQHRNSDDTARRKVLAKELSNSYKEYFDKSSVDWFDIERDAMTN